MRELLVNGALARIRTTIFLMIGIMLFGLVARVLIPVENNPHVYIPAFMVQFTHEGISPEDASRLLVEPFEIELKSVEGINEVTAYSQEGVATVLVEFDDQMAIEEALQDVRAAVDRTKPHLPNTAEEPRIDELGTSEFPAIIVSVTSDELSERAISTFARDLRDDLEALPGVVEARLQGVREEVLEVHVKPELLAAYEVSFDQLSASLIRNSRFIAAGALNSGEGRIQVRVPAVFETAEEVVLFPIRSTSDSVVTVGDIANVRRTFKDRLIYSRVNGAPAVSLWVFNRANTNMIDIVSSVKTSVDEWRKTVPADLGVVYTSDQGPWAVRQVTELQGNIITAMMLVMVLVVASMGIRQGIIVGLGIPVSFLFSLTFLWLVGYSFNFMVMFGMLLGLGILIDGAIVVTEFADRKMAEGLSRQQAFSTAAKRMFWPVVASVATTLMAFLPLLFWPGVAGQFMRHLPVTVFTVLIGSLLYALIFCPALGSVIGQRIKRSESSTTVLRTLESGDPRHLRGFTGLYARSIEKTSRYSILTLLVTGVVILGAFVGYASANLGMVFFNQSDPQYLQAFVRAQGNFSPEESLELVKEVEDEILQIPGMQNVSLSTSMGEVSMGMMSLGGMPQDAIGLLLLEMRHEAERTVNGWEAIELIRERTANLPGIMVEVNPMEEGPPVGKPIQIELSSNTREALMPVLLQIHRFLDEEVDGLLDIQDSRPLPGVVWELEVDRAQAALYGADVQQVGTAIQLVTNGFKLGEYRPEDTDDSIDIQLRYPSSDRNLQSLDNLMIATETGLVPISNFVTRKPTSSIQTLIRRDRKAVETLSANVAPGVLADNKIREIREWVNTTKLDPRVHIAFRGANEEQQDSIRFILIAFCFAMVGMFTLLITQFNSIYQALLILQAVAMSTAGVLIGLIITQNPFSAILTGVGVVALAGVVVNTNIVLIDTFNQVRGEHPELDHIEVIVRTCAQRLRPLLLTSLTTIVGLLPLACNTSVDFVNRTVTYGGQMAAFWGQLTQAIVFGLSFATILTLFVTPAMLAIPYQTKNIVKQVVAWAKNSHVAFR